jgi:negative regulator of sigma E activity
MKDSGRQDTEAEARLNDVARLVGLKKYEQPDAAQLQRITEGVQAALAAMPAGRVISFWSVPAPWLRVAAAVLLMALGGVYVWSGSTGLELAQPLASPLTTNDLAPVPVAATARAQSAPASLPEAVSENRELPDDLLYDWYYRVGSGQSGVQFVGNTRP